MNVVLLEPAEVGPAGEVTLADARAVHLLQVLHVDRGSTVRVGLIDGPPGTAAVTALAGSSVTLRCVFEAATPPRPPVDLLLALPRPKVMRRLWAQLAAIGVGRIILTNAERVERNYFDTHVLAPECYRPLLVEGLQQARDTRLPAVSIHRQFKVLVEDHLDALAGGALRVAADPGAPSRVDAVVSGRAGADRVLVAVGPEGGWNGFERALLEAHGFELAALGARTLRVDTACIALLATVHAALAHRA